MEGDISQSEENSPSNHHVNGMSNGYSNEKHKSSKSDHKDKHRDKDRDHKSSKSKDHKSSSRDKEKDRHHSSSSSNRDKSSSSHKSSSRDKDKDRHRDKDKDRHKSSSSSKDKDKHSKDHKSSSRDKDRDKEKERSKDHKDRDKDKDKHRHSSSSGKDKHRDKHREKDRHKDRKEKDRKSEKLESPEKAEIKAEAGDSPQNGDDGYFDDDEQKLVIKEEYETEAEKFDKLDNSQASSCDYNISQFKDESKFEATDYNISQFKDESKFEATDYKSENDEEEEEEEQEPEEEDSEEDIPLAERMETLKRKYLVDSDGEDEKPVKSKKAKKTKSKKRELSDDDEDMTPNKKKGKKAAKPTIKKEEPSSPKKRKKKEEEEQDVWKWWEEEKRDDGVKWKFLEHKGPVFAPLYERLPKNVKFYYDGKEMSLSEEAEEVAGFYAKMLDHDYTTKDVFNHNFFKDWRKVMTDEERKKITDLNKCDFKKMHAYFMDVAEKNRNRTKEEKAALKEKNEEILKEYGFCVIDGHKEKIGNFKIEPPGLFRGRGEHPKMGMLKKRVMPEDVLINCSKDSNIPKPPPGHKWKEVRHDPSVTWLASWTENVQNQGKYVMLNPSSKLKGEKDWQKYEVARRLHKCIDKIRSEYRDDWKSKEMRIRQRAVALYFIDKLALRAGNEKDEDQADTVGCCSLRVEHIELHEQKDGKNYVVVFDFLGKDSIRYYNEVEVEKRVFKNLKLFTEKKSPGDDLFDRLNTAVMNKHLNELMEGLTAKVFRTYNASITLQQQLDKLTNADDSISEKILSYNRANRAVAILCNHQRAVPKGHAKSMEKLKEKIDAKRDQIKDAERGVKDAQRDAKNGSVKEKQIYDKKKKQLEKMREQLAKLEIQETDRDENKTIALGTSKLNYLDPRISVAWCKKYDVPIEKIYNKTQRDKFRWAIDMAGPDYIF